MAIYAFNLAYPKNFEKTLLFFQRIILRLDDEQPLDKNNITCYILAQSRNGKLTFIVFGQ